MNRRLIGACIVVLGLVAGAAAATPYTAPVLGNVHPGVFGALAAGDTPVNVIVTGQPHVGFDGDLFASRASAMATLGQRSAPFFDAVRRVAQTTGGTVRETWAVAPAVHLLATQATIGKLSRMQEVRWVETDSDDAVRIDPLPAADIGTLNTGGRQMIQAEDIWALGFRGEGIRLAVIDTGIYPGHEAFKFADGSTRIVAWRDWVGGQPNPYDDNGHGTHVAGTAAGSRLFNDPTHGFFTEEGVAPRAQILVSKFLNSGGGGSWANGINSLQWSFDNGADITSNSWGGGCSTSPPGDNGVAVTATVRQLTDLGMLSVVAAGTSGGGGVLCPGRGESALTIGAVDQNRVIAGFSSRGPCSDPDTGTPSRICPDVVAKGVNVRSSWPRPAAPSGYNTISGTSMATPHVAGAAVLAEQMKRALTGTGWDTAARAEEQVFKQTTLDLGTAGPDNSYGWGLVQLLNVYALLANQDEADIVDTFEITLPVVRQGNTTTLSFGVRNAGGRVASGPFRATLTDPDGNVTVLRDRNIALGFLDGETIVHPFTVGANDLPGTYTFRGTFDYTWTDPDGGIHTGSVDRSGTFQVRRIVIEAGLDGFPAAAQPLLPQGITFNATNNGNEGASDVVILVEVPVDYVFIPGTNYDPANGRTRYSNPAPDTVTENPGYGYTTLSYR
ncbi:MAG: S8 family serine peptidase, partial [Actinomycetota bacterium]